MITDNHRCALTVNVLALVGGNITSSKFTVGGLRGAVTTGEIVDDEGGELVAGNVLQVFLDNADASTGVAGTLVSYSFLGQV